VTQEGTARPRAAALANVARELAQSLDVGAVSRRIVEGVRDLLEAPLAVLYAVVRVMVRGICRSWPEYVLRRAPGKSPAGTTPPSPAPDPPCNGYLLRVGHQATARGPNLNP